LPPEGSFSEDELGDYLDVLENLALAYERGLVDLASIDDWHGATIEQTYKHSERQRYIRVATGRRRRGLHGRASSR
jgi:hypothetical protein